MCLYVYVYVYSSNVLCICGATNTTGTLMQNLMMISKYALDYGDILSFIASLNVGAVLSLLLYEGEC